MRLFTGFLFFLVFVTNSAFGQLPGIIVDNSTMPADAIGEIYFNQQGQLVVISRVGVEYEIREKSVIPGDVAINSFTINNAVSATVEVGATATMRWSTSDAKTCSASATGPVPLPGWNESTTIGLAGPASVQFNQAGVYNLSLHCEGNNGSVKNSVVSANVGSATINSFTVNPNAANKGSNVTFTLTWASTNTSNCYGSWPNADNLPSSGTSSISVTNIQSDPQFKLTCINSFDEDVSTAVVTISDPAPTCSVTLSARRDNSWNALFGAVWPLPASRETRVAIPERGYYAVKFDTKDFADKGAVSTFEASGTAGWRLLSISETPGCFNVAPECKTGARKSSIGWDTTGSGVGCQLKPNTTYYWNTTFTDGITPGTSSCIGTACETYLWVVNSP